MNLLIYRDPKFEEALESLRKEGGKGLFAVKKVEEIIKRLNSQGNRIHRAGKLTKRGEHRIRYCRKYDLCSGYRLITIQNKNYLILAYIGSHDDCDRWLERNKRLKYDVLEIEPEFKKEEEFLVDSNIQGDLLEEEFYVQEYEKSLEERLKDNFYQDIVASWFKR